MKSLVIFFFLLPWSSSFAQDFVLTQDNYRSLKDETKNYIIIEYPDLSQKELFDRSKMFIISNYNNLKSDGLNEVQYSQLKLRSRSEGTKVRILGKDFLSNYLITTVEFSFKDGKVMIKPTFEEYEDSEDFSKIYLIKGNSAFGKSIFNKKGQIWLKNHYEVANAKINEFMQAFKKSIQEAGNW